MHLPSKCCIYKSIAIRDIFYISWCFTATKDFAIFSSILSNKILQFCMQFLHTIYGFKLHNLLFKDNFLTVYKLISLL